MPNNYYERKAEFKPFTTARSDDVRGEFDGIQSGFEKLPKPREDGTIGFMSRFTILTPTESSHPATKAMVDTEKDKNDEQDNRLDGAESILSGIGPADERYTTLRYVATDGQNELVLPLQFESLAYVFVNGGRKFQTVDFAYDSATKTIEFTPALNSGDIVLVDVGIVPDAVLADLLAIQNDIAARHSDIISRHNVIAEKHVNVVALHDDVVSKHNDVETWHQNVQNIAADFGDLDTLKNSIEQSEQVAINKAQEASGYSDNAENSAVSASDSADRAEAAAQLVGDVKYAGIAMYTSKIINLNMTIPPNVNAQLIGPKITVADGVRVYVSDNSALTVR